MDAKFFFITAPAAPRHRLRAGLRNNTPASQHAAMPPRKSSTAQLARIMTRVNSRDSHLSEQCTAHVYHGKSALRTISLTIFVTIMQDRHEHRPDNGCKVHLSKQPRLKKAPHLNNKNTPALSVECSDSMLQEILNVSVLHCGCVL